ncbi:hypothetical protein GCM10009737_17360 [Nocardioides lentus]|uniref:DUF2384 domain-containing protein n=1 Tax=Nocardioides lentus TaxID=338077 RepID=A0ABN2P9Y3_9ACTN
MAEHDDRAERLAAWLGDLGLTDHLAEAGLPTFTRGPAGEVHWTDPRTGGALSEAQLADLDALLHQDGEEPGHAVPVTLVQLRRRAQVRARLLASGWHDYAALADLRGASLESTRFAVHQAQNRHQLLVVPLDERSVVPAFQLTTAGEVRAELGPVLEPLLRSGTDPWSVWAWLTQPAALLGGAVPEAALRDPDEAPLVRHAAVRLAERAR